MGRRPFNELSKEALDADQEEAAEESRTTFGPRGDDEKLIRDIELI